MNLFISSPIFVNFQIWIYKFKARKNPFCITFLKGPMKQNGRILHFLRLKDGALKGCIFERLTPDVTRPLNLWYFMQIPRRRVWQMFLQLCKVGSTVYCLSTTSLGSHKTLLMLAFVLIIAPQSQMCLDIFQHLFPPLFFIGNWCRICQNWSKNI